MPAWAWILIVIGVLIVLGVVAWNATARRKTEHLRDRFGPEYNRVTSTAESKREAERELAQREERRDELDIKPLAQESRALYTEEWKSIQAEFVDEPGKAVSRADSLLQKVMSERGYPVEKFEQRAADLSVDHPKVVENYREGHRLATSGNGNGARTEELRQAMRHYRALFDELVQST
jgi:sensor domain CHASE-containing protein